MDLHLTDARPTVEEQAAVDSKLGAPQSAWEGAARAVNGDGRTSSAGNEKVNSQRHLLLPVLHAIQERIFYGMFSLTERPTAVAHVCDDIACMTHGSEQLCAELKKRLGPEGKPCLAGQAMWLRSNCLGLCERAPAVLVSKAAGD